MVRMVAVSLTRPWASSQARSLPSARACMRANVTSPPRMASPCFSKPARSASDSAPTAVMTVTPSATQAMKT